MALRLVIVSVVCVWLAAGCFGSGDGEPADAIDGSVDDPTGAETLVGDWIHCRDTACETFDGDGTRFTDDGSAFELDIDDGPVGNQPVCVVVQELVGHYTFVDDVVRFDDGTQYQVDFNGNQASFREVKSSERADMLRVQARPMESCPSDDMGPKVSGP